MPLGPNRPGRRSRWPPPRAMRVALRARSQPALEEAVGKLSQPARTAEQSSVPHRIGQHRLGEPSPVRGETMQHHGGADGPAGHHQRSAPGLVLTEQPAADRASRRWHQVPAQHRGVSERRAKRRQEDPTGRRSSRHWDRWLSFGRHRDQAKVAELRSVDLTLSSAQPIHGRPGGVSPANLQRPSPEPDDSCRNRFKSPPLGCPVAAINPRRRGSPLAQVNRLGRAHRSQTVQASSAFDRQARSRA